MAYTFNVRVVLHGASYPSDYRRLHRTMADAGFDKYILGDDGRWYELPPGEYYCVSEAGTPQTIRDQARAIANRTGFNNAVRVTREDYSAWVGLEPVVFALQPALHLGLAGLLPAAPAPRPLNQLFFGLDDGHLP